MIDYELLMLSPIYSSLGLEATLTSVDGLPTLITIVDKSEGVVLDGVHGGQHFGAAKPAACVRVSELDENSVSRDSLKGATLSFSGKDWRIAATQPKPCPGSKGELYLILQTP